MISKQINTAIPASAGIGLKPEHYDVVLETAPDLGFFEVHAENYMGAGGQPHHYLSAIRRDYPLSVHGVGLSIGGARGLDRAHLARVKGVVERYQPGLVSEHLAWSSHGFGCLNDLLPLPYTAEAVMVVSNHLDDVQSVLGRQVLLENPSTYIQFETSEMDEVTFLGEIVARSGCGLLLDVNNVYVSATNHGYDAAAYVDCFPLEAVRQVHLAGFFEDRDDAGQPLLIDSHDAPVAGPVWDLYQKVVARAGPLPTLIERDGNLPPWATLYAEAQYAERMLQRGCCDVVA